MCQGKQSVTDTEIIEAFEEVQGPFAAASEIADFFGHTRQWAHKRLTELHESGSINRKKLENSQLSGGSRINYSGSPKGIGDLHQ